jgi:fucose permease
VTRRVFALAICAVAMAVFGLVLALPGVAFGLDSVRAHLGLGVEGQARLVLVLFVGFLSGTVLSGPLADHAGLGPVLGGGTITLAIGLIGFAWAPTQGTALVAVFALGVGGASVNTSANALVSAVYPERRRAMLTWLAFACGLGGLTLPLVVATAADQWTTVLVSAAIASALVSAAVVRLEAPRVVHPFSWSGLRDVMSAPGFVWYLMALVCQGGNEAALAGWLTPQVTARGLSSTVALTALTCHWIGIIVGRIGMATMVERFGTQTTIVTGAVVASLGTLSLVFAREALGLTIAATVAGLGIAGVFSVTMAEAGNRYPGRAGTMFAALLAAGQVGGIVIPWSVGRIAERVTLDTGLGLIVVTTLAVAGLAVAPSYLRARLAAMNDCTPSQT